MPRTIGAAGRRGGRYGLIKEDTDGEGVGASGGGGVIGVSQSPPKWAPGAPNFVSHYLTVSS